MSTKPQIKGNKKILARILLFSAALISQAFSAHTTYASQPAPKQLHQNHDICVVYDNSGSMLGSNEICDSQWYEAAYAVELVASSCTARNMPDLPPLGSTHRTEQSWR